MLARFINSLFGEISRMETLFYYYRSLTSIKDDVIWKDCRFWDTYNCIFLILSCLERSQGWHTPDTSDSRTTNIVLIRGIFFGSVANKALTMLLSLLLPHRETEILPIELGRDFLRARASKVNRDSWSHRSLTVGYDNR